MDNKKDFGKIRSIIFPIYASELKKFIPLTSIFFIISFNYSILRSAKDMFIMRDAPAEVIYYIKVFGVMPFIIFLTILYSKITKQVSRDTRFNIIITYFLLFFGLCYFFLLPHLNDLKLNGIANSLQASFPKFGGLWEAIRFWPLSLLYINAEAWGTLALSVLFWTFVNEITPIEQSKRFYTFLSLGASIGLIVAGKTLHFFGDNFLGLVGLVVFFVALLLVLYNLFAREIRTNPVLYQIDQTEQRVKKEKVKSSLGDSLKLLASSKYLALIAILVLGYNMFISLFESIWKAQIKELVNMTGDQSISAVVYGDQGVYGGIITIVLTIFFSRPIINRGWKFAASFTPVVALICTFIFFAFLYFQDSLAGLTEMFKLTPLKMAVMFGLVNVVFIKSAKYILFDPTKEMSYKPLSKAERDEGKPVIDGIVSRSGKSLGSLILTAILVPFLGDGKIVNAQYYVFFLVVFILLAWIFAIGKLSTLYEKAVANQDNNKPIN